MSLKQQSRELEVTMVVSSRILELMSYVMTLELDINSRPSTLHNQMALLRGRIEHLLIWQGLRLVSTIWVNPFGTKQSTRLAIVETAYIVTHWKRRHLMSSWMVESPTLEIFEYLVANATYWRKTLDWASLTINVMNDSCLDTQPLAKHIEFRIWQVVLLKKFMILNLMKPRVPKMRMRT
jgi:hypothetical protein